MYVVEICIVVTIVQMIALCKVARMNYELNREIEEWNKSLKK
jgi:hypothetical protein